MATPALTYNSKTIDLTKLPRHAEVNPLVPRAIHKSITGVFDVVMTPRVDVLVVVEWSMIDSATMLAQLNNWWQWAERGEEWALALDSSKTVDTLTAVAAAAGDTTFYVDNPDGITAGQVYKLIDGHNYELVTISSVSGDLVTLTAALDSAYDVGTIFRDQFYFPAMIWDAEADHPIALVDAGDMQAFPPSRFYLSLKFREDTSQEVTMLFKALIASAAGSDVATAQPWFPASGGVSLAANTTYFFEGYLRTSRAAGAVSHTTSLLFAGTATLTGIAYMAEAQTGDAAANVAQNSTLIEVATATVVKAASTSTTEQIGIRVTGVVRINAAGTFIPQFIYSAAPGGAPTVLTNTYFRLWPEGSGSVASRGTWA